MATIVTKLSAKLLMELVRVVKVDESEVYVPVDIPDMKTEKNGWEMDVTVIDP